jgi:hypothetical protein
MGSARHRRLWVKGGHWQTLAVGPNQRPCQTLAVYAASQAQPIFCPASEHHYDPFDKPQKASLAKAIDELNEKFGKIMVGFGLLASTSRTHTSKISFTARARSERVLIA